MLINSSNTALLTTQQKIRPRNIKCCPGNKKRPATHSAAPDYACSAAHERGALHSCGRVDGDERFCSAATEVGGGVHIKKKLRDKENRKNAANKLRGVGTTGVTQVRQDLGVGFVGFEVRSSNRFCPTNFELILRPMTDKKSFSSMTSME